MLTTRQKEIILALADNGMRIRRAADAMYCNHAGLYHHMNNIKDRTGLDPRDFWDLIKLVEMVKGENNA